MAILIGAVAVVLHIKITTAASYFPTCLVPLLADISTEECGFITLSGPTMVYYAKPYPRGATSMKQPSCFLDCLRVAVMFTSRFEASHIRYPVKITMSKELQRLCDKGNYEKICRMLQASTSGPSERSKPSSLTQNDIELLRLHSAKKVLAHIHQKQTPPAQLIKVCALLGPEHFTQLRLAVTNYIVSQSAAEMAQAISATFTDLSSLMSIYKALEDITEDINGRYSTLPDDWGVDLLFVIQAFYMIKHRVCDCFFSSEPDEESYASGLLATIRIEHLMKPYFEFKKCCASSAKCSVPVGQSFCTVRQPASRENYTPRDTAEAQEVKDGARCTHHNILSGIMLPNIGLYFSFALRQFRSQSLDQSAVEHGIIQAFLAFFKQVKSVLKNIRGIATTEVLNIFVEYIGQHALLLLKQIRIQQDFSDGLILLNTILWFQETVHDLVNRINSIQECGAEVHVLNEIRKLENAQTQQLEKYISRSFISLDLDTSNYIALEKWFDGIVSRSVGLCDELRNLVGEMVTSVLLLKISLLKMTKARAELVLSDICDLERHSMATGTAVPHIWAVKEYLKIFMCPTDDKERFVDNFMVLAAERFSFYQILSALENKEDALELFLTYKKQEERAKPIEL